MKKSLGVAFVLVFMIAALPVLAENEGNYRDQFKDPSYSGDDGSLSWDGPWFEVGENDGPDDGAVHITPDSHCAGNECLHIYSPGASFSEIGAGRFADLSIFSSAELCFYLSSYVLSGFELLNTSVEVQLTAHGGDDWMTIDSFTLVELWDTDTERTIQVPGYYLKEDFGLRFVVGGLLGGEVFIDDVEITGTFKPVTTTTSSTTTTTSPTTTTTKPKTSTTRPDEPDRDEVIPVTTTAPTSTTTRVADSSEDPEGAAVGLGASQPPSGPEGGLHLSEWGIQADYGARPIGGQGMITPEVLALTVNYEMAVEVIASNWIWSLALVVIVTAALIGGLDRKKRFSGLRRSAG